MNLFNREVPSLTRTDHEGHTSTFAAAWKGPLVLLVNHRSRSGKEVIARAAQRAHRATIVGERTAGAVLAGKPIKLSDGSLLYVAADDLAVDGERLEGVGVTPDVVARDDLAFAAGHDPQLDRAFEVAVAAARGHDH